jgi:hypothetical protein
MIKINFIEPNSPGWIAWKGKCATACNQLIADVAAGALPVITSLYKEQKEVLFRTSENYYGKCVYCETLITSNQPGDVEHYRPKGRITDAKNKRVLVRNALGHDIPHPGYYWLAYEHTNLLPGCIDCNRPSSGNSGGTLIGKWDQFPVTGNHAISPGGEINEDPLIINPTIENPDDHLEIDSLGLLSHKTPKGETTINIFGLNLRQTLVEERKRAYKSIKDKARLLLIALTMEADPTEYIIEIENAKEGSLPYSMAGRRAWNDFLTKNPRIVQLFNQ